jgi:putative oligomerization/nucleic acid binding protein/phospholipase D-like protein
MFLAASDYPLLDVFLTVVFFFAWLAWFWILIGVLGDLFRRDDVGGGGKVLWVIFLILLPFLGVLIYLVGQHEGMAKRNLARAQAAQAQFDDYVRQAAGGSAAEIAKAKELLDSGAISQAEFEQMKQKALS